MKDLSILSNEELKDFFNSFDRILCDVDGVIWNITESISGTEAAIKNLKKLGKQMIFVSNNTLKNLDVYTSQFKNHGFDVEKKDIVTPTVTMLSYLHKHNLNEKKLFVVSMNPLKNFLKAAGFKLAESGPDRIEDIHEFISKGYEDDEVGAVIFDVDLNLNYLNLQKAAHFLKNPEVKFLAGATDVRVPIGMNRAIVGPGNFLLILEEMTGRKFTPLAKPSPYLNEYIVKKYKIDDVSRVLFIGDSIPEDMGFAAKFGYRKLLVFTGLTKVESIEDWTFPEEFKPDFYVDSLKTVNDLICRIFKNI